MPIIVKDFKWKQTENTIIIYVPLRGIHHSKVDIFYSERYIKANYDPFFFEVLLLNPIIVKESHCTLTNKNMVFELVKTEPTTWENLEPNLSRQEKTKLKLECIQKEHENIQEHDKLLKDQKHVLKKVAVQEQIKIDAEIRESIDNIKKEEKDKALGDLKQWQNNLSDARKLRKKKKKFEKYLSQRPGEISISDKVEPEEIEIPKPRTTVELEVDFTPRVFPTPSRESRETEENEWLKMQAEARRTVGFISEDIRPEERNPQYLKAKGDEFMKNDNYLGAISAYSFGIKLSEKFVDLYIARSLAHFKQGNFCKCTFDCSTALDLMKPEVQANLNQRAECIGRRGMALCKLKKLSQGIDELEASLKLVHNEEFKQFLNEAEKEWMNQSDSD